MTYVSSSPFMNNIGQADFRRVRTVAVNKSPFNGATHRSGMQDDVWQFRFDYDLMTREQAAPLLGAIAGQRNGTGTFNVFDPDWMYGRPSPARPALTYGVISAAGQTGPLIATAWPVVGLVASAGDKLWIQDVAIGIRMYEVVADAYAVSGGGATIILDTPLASVPAIGSQIGVDWDVNGIFLSARMTGFEKRSQPGGLFQISVTGEELL